MIPTKNLMARELWKLGKISVKHPVGEKKQFWDLIPKFNVSYSFWCNGTS